MSEKRPKRPKFPRRQWLPGQTERVEPPKKGAGYDRPRERQDTDKEIGEDLDKTNTEDERRMPHDE